MVASGPYLQTKGGLCAVEGPFVEEVEACVVVGLLLLVELHEDVAVEKHREAVQDFAVPYVSADR